MGGGTLDIKVVGICDGSAVGFLDGLFDIKGGCDGDDAGVVPGPLPGRKVGINVASSLTAGDVTGDRDLSFSISVVGTYVVVGPVVVVISIVDGD